MKIDPKVACPACNGSGHRCVTCDNTGYWRKDHIKFCQDMRKANIPFRFYEGRNFYCGPAAVSDHFSDVMSKTSVPCTYDNLGKDHIVYPK